MTNYSSLFLLSIVFLQWALWANQRSKFPFPDKFIPCINFHRREHPYLPPVFCMFRKNGAQFFISSKVVKNSRYRKSTFLSVVWKKRGARHFSLLIILSSSFNWKNGIPYFENGESVFVLSSSCTWNIVNSIKHERCLL